MRKHQGIVVHVNDPAFRGHPLGDFMSVVRRRKTGADVEKLANPGLSGQVPDRAGKKGPGGAGNDGDTRKNLPVLVTGHPVDSVVVLAPQPVVPDTGRVRHRCVDRRPGGASGSFRPRLASG